MIKLLKILDLEITLEAHQITTKTHFKPVDRDSYIPVDSCHFDPWLINIPKGQMMRLRRNCSDPQVFLEQANMIGMKFINKGYSEDFIQSEIKKVYEIPRDTLIQDKEKAIRSEQELPIILNYNIQHRQIESILRKHWPILKADRQLQSILPIIPRVIYRRAPTLRDLVAKNVPDTQLEIVH